MTILPRRISFTLISVFPIRSSFFRKYISCVAASWIMAFGVSPQAIPTTLNPPTISFNLGLGGSGGGVGMVGGGAISTSVFPFILRGIKLLGTDSVQCPMDVRLKVWEKLAREWKPARLERLVKTITLDDLDDSIRTILNGKSTGRTLVVPKTKAKD